MSCFCAREIFSSKKKKKKRLEIILITSIYNTTIEDNSLNIHYRNLQKVVTEIFKIKNDLSPELLNDVFEFNEKLYFLRTKVHFWSRRIRTIKYGTEVPSSLSPKLWNLALNEYKTIDSLADFKVKIKTWISENCPRRLCKTYIHQIGFI